MPESRESGPVRYRALLTDSSLVSIFLISTVAAVSVNAVPVALPAIGEAFRLTESEIGLVMSVFSLAVILMAPVVGTLGDLYGRRAVVLASLLVFGCSGLAMLAVTTYPAMLALRAVQGAAFAGTLPFTATLTGDLYSGAAGSAAQGLRSGLTGVAGAITPVVAGVLVVVAWQYPFVLFVLTFPAAAVVYRYFPDPADAPHGGERQSVGLAAYWRLVWEAADRRLALLLAGGFVLFFLKGGFVTFLPVYAVAGLGLSVTTAGSLLGLYGGVRAVVSPLTGSMVARVGRRATLVLGAGLAAAGMGAVPFAPNRWTLAMACVGYAAGEAVLNPVVNDAVAASAPAAQRAGIMSGLSVLKDGALGVAPVLLGVVIGASGYERAFLVAAALGVAYGAVVAFRLSSSA